MLGVSNHVMMKGKKQRKGSKLKDVKVTYISSPMKVKTSASNFRALVQELTGQDSNVAEMFIDAEGNNNNNNNNNNGSAESVHHHKGGSTQQWSEGYFPETTNYWLKPDFNEFDSRSSMEPLNGHILQDLLSFDML